MERKLVRIANAILDLEPVAGLDRRRRMENHEGELRLNNNESAKNASPAVIDSIRAGLDNMALNWYQDSEATKLRDKIAGYVSLPPEYVSCYAGTGLALEHIFRTYLETGTELLTLGPCDQDVSIAALCTGARVVDLEPKDIFNPTVEDVVNKITARTRAVYLKSPNEYTGASFSEAELVFLLAYAERTMIIIDEEFYEYSGGSMTELVARFPNLTILRTFANAFGLAGLKAGYILSDPENLEFIHRAKGDAAPDAIARMAAVAALEDLDHTREYVVEVNRSKKAIATSLPEAGYDFGLTRANFFLLRVSDSRGAEKALRNEGIAVLDLSRVTDIEGYLRITLGTPEQMDRLILTLRRLAERYATGFNRSRMVITPETDDSRRRPVPAE